MRVVPRARWTALLAACVAAIGGCTGDSVIRDMGTGDGFVTVDTGRPDLGRDMGPDASDAQADALTDAPPPDAPPPDAPPPDAGDGGDDAAITCVSGRECPPGLLCIDGVCTADADCCDLIDCRDPAVCDPFSCSCRATGGCCDTGFCPTEPGVSAFCDFESCECMEFTCTPACGPGFRCDFGSCSPECWFTPCPPTEFCSFEMGCVPAQCTPDECESMSPPMRCDPSIGCQPTCVGDFSWCTSMGGRCFLDQCVDDSCGERSGLPPRFCTYTFDCCGNAVCQHVDDPEPFCPDTCGEPATPPSRPDLCQCGFGFGGPSFCMDLRTPTFFPGPEPGRPTPVPPPID